MAEDRALLEVRLDDRHRVLLQNIEIAQHVADGHGREGATHVTHHVHGSRNSPGVFAAHIHAGAPGARHYQVITEAGHPHSHHRRHGISQVDGEHQ